MPSRNGSSCSPDQGHPRAGLELLIGPIRSTPSRPSSTRWKPCGARGLAARSWRRPHLSVQLHGLGYRDPELATYRPCWRGRYLQTIADKHRRHVITTPTPGRPANNRPQRTAAQCAPKRWHEFRIPTGPSPLPASHSRVGHRSAQEDIGTWDLRVNGEPCTFTGEVKHEQSAPSYPLYGFRVPPAAMNRGYNVIEVQSKSAGTITGWRSASADPLQFDP